MDCCTPEKAALTARHDPEPVHSTSKKLRLVDEQRHRSALSPKAKAPSFRKTFQFRIDINMKELVPG